MKQIEFNSLTLEELKNFMIGINERSYRGEQLFIEFNKHMKLNFDEMTGLPKTLRNNLKDIGFVNEINVLSRFDSSIDNTKKYLFHLNDGNIVEGVAMEYPHGVSLCISTQVGCKMGCEFCASTKDGLIRNLTPAEMLNQIYLVEKDLDIRISNIVLMGSGEPLDNYTNCLKFINIIHDEKGHNISLRNITLSTCGVVSRIYDLAEENLPITLSISLHSPFDKERQLIMPIAKAYSIDELIKSCKYYADKTNRRITFEYTLIKGVNDGDREVEELVQILNGLNVHINLIPLNPIEEFNLDRPTKAHVEEFYKKLISRNIQSTIRSEKGSDISASCGQLRRSYLKE